MNSNVYVRDVLTWENRKTEESVKHILNYIETGDYDAEGKGDRSMLHKCYLYYHLDEHYNRSNVDFEIETDLDHEYFIENIPNFNKWYVYYIIAKLMVATFNTHEYFRLLILLNVKNDEKIGRKEKLLTEECFVDYPPIADFFMACAGLKDLTNTNYTREYYNQDRFVETGIFLISREIPYAIINYIDFNPLPNLDPQIKHKWHKNIPITLPNFNYEVQLSGFGFLPVGVSGSEMLEELDEQEYSELIIYNNESVKYPQVFFFNDNFPYQESEWLYERLDEEEDEDECEKLRSYLDVEIREREFHKG